MLSITAEEGDYVLVGDSLIYVEFLHNKTKKIRIAVDSPSSNTIVRMGLLHKMLEVNGYIFSGFRDNIRVYNKLECDPVTSIVKSRLLTFNQAIKEIINLPKDQNKFKMSIRS